jgi:hypothetical protein
MVVLLEEFVKPLLFSDSTTHDGFCKPVGERLGAFVLWGKVGLPGEGERNNVAQRAYNHPNAP